MVSNSLNKSFQAGKITAGHRFAIIANANFPLKTALGLYWSLLRVEALKKIWKDPVWSKIIASGVIALLVWLLSKVKLIKQYFMSGVDFLLSQTSLPNWLLLFSFSISTIFIIWLILDFRASKMPNKYIRDHIEGLDWEWKYYGSKITDLKPLCPKCKHEILERQVQQFGHSHFPKHEFFCEGCGYFLAINDNPVYEFYSRINRHIERKIRTKEWLKKQA